MSTCSTSGTTDTDVCAQTYTQNVVKNPVTCTGFEVPVPGTPVQ